MGIPRFYRWLSERFPLINENITQEQIPEFDNLYLDMNGIIHNCSHNNTGGLCVKEENDVFVDAFNYICRLFQIIRPKKLLYMAVDGCAPRAKMNQQRSRRFRAANDAREAREKAKEMGEDLSSPQFDSNCITPGTEFMFKLTTHLRYFICKKIQEDPRWQQVTIVLSGPDTPGEGEHKIMDYIRASKAQPDYDPNTRHCLYGLDADLIMLALASHELHFALLREEVVFARRETKTTEQRMLISKDRFQLLHVALLREYMDLEFASNAAGGRYSYSLERVIDDFILFCILVGNDFLPCLPFAEIGESGLEYFFSAYKEHLKSAAADPWLTGGCGQINFKQLARFLKKYAEVEDGLLTAACDGGEWVLGKQRLVGPSEAPTPPEYTPDLPIEPPPTSELARVQWYEIKFGMDVDTHAGVQDQRKLFQSYLEGLHWVMRYYFRGPSEASWSWYYPYYHAPMAYDLAHYDKLPQPGIELEVGQPFRPFQQLMAVLPSSSKSLLPACFQWLFDSQDSPILSFYPQKFVVDMDGVKVPWGGMTLIPFIDPMSLVSAMESSKQQMLSKAEEQRNEFRNACTLRYDMKAQQSLASTWKGKYPDLVNCPVRIAEFTHPPLPSGVDHFPNYLLPGARSQDFGFPTLHAHPLTHSFEAGVKVFQFEARGLSLILHLRPEAVFEPPAQELWAMMKAPSAIIDYPCVHRGKVVAVHTPFAKYLASGKTLENNPVEHEQKVWSLLQEWRQRGLTVAFTGAAKDGEGEATSGPALWRGREGDLSENELCQQPIVEVKVMESSYVDRDGRRHFQWQAGSAFRLLHLVRPEKAAPRAAPKTLSERFPVGTSVLCIDPQSEVFGEVGRLSNCGDAAAEIKAVFASHLPQEEREKLQASISQVLEVQQAQLKWYDLQQLAKQAELEVPVVQQIVGSVMARCADYIREDLGMNLVTEKWQAAGQGSPACLPCYSYKMPKGWIFSDLAVKALQDYREKFPGVFEALRSRRTTNQRQIKDLEQRAIFPDRADKDYCSRQLVKYCNSCEWKRLKLAPTQYMALTTQSVSQVACSVDEALRCRRKEDVTTVGADSLCRTEEAFQVPAALRMPSGEDLAVGQRGVYTNPHGAVPCGVQGTVIGIYGTGETQQIEVLLDEECFGATDLHGRTPRLRGLQGAPSVFLPLFPRILKNSVSNATRSSDAPAVAQRGGGAQQREARPAAQDTEPAADEMASRALMSLLQGGEPRGHVSDRSSAPAAAKAGGSNKNRPHANAPGNDVAAAFSALTLEGSSRAPAKVVPEARAGDAKEARGPTKIMVNQRRAGGDAGATPAVVATGSANKIRTEGMRASGGSAGPATKVKKEIPEDLWSKAFNDLLNPGAKVQAAHRRS